MQTKLSVYCEKVIEAGWLATLILVPVFFNIYSARTFEPDKLTLMRSIALVMALAWLIKIAEVGFGGANSRDSGPADKETSLAGRGWRRLLDVPLFLPTLVLVLSYTISTVLSISPRVALWGSYQRMQGTYTAFSYIVIFALLATHLRSRAQIDRLVVTVILTSLPVGLYGIIQHYGLDPLPWAGDVTQRVASNMGNPIFVASYLIMAIPLTLAWLLKSMAAIVSEEDASWGHTLLAAVYIFVLAVQVITVIFSQSRGPLLGVLAGLFFFVFLGLLWLYRQADGADRISPGNALASLLETAAPLGLGGVLGVLWFNLSGPVSVGQTQLDLWALVAVGMLLGVIVVGLMVAVRAAIRRGWVRLWLNWVLLAVFMVGFLAMLNVPDSPFIAIRSLPTVGRLTQLFQPGEGTGKVRVLIWGGVLDLITPHDPIGIPDEFQDTLNPVRPLIGYGPESMFNAFAKVYPPELAHVEQRGSSADRSHNETYDSLAITGVIGFIAYYFLMFSLFYYLLKAVGWVPDDGAKRRLFVLLGIGGVLGIAIPPIVTGTFVFSGLGLPAGMLLMMFVYLVWQAAVYEGIEQEPDTQQDAVAESSLSGWGVLLLLGIFAALVGHFVEVHFVFSIAATYVYFWIYAALVVAWLRQSSQEAHRTEAAALSWAAGADAQSNETQAPAPTTRSSRRRRRRRKPASPVADAAPASLSQGEDWETWLGVMGLVVAIILNALIFDFVTAQFDVSTSSFSMLWMFGIVWIIGLAIGLGEVAIRQPIWQKSVNWGRALLLYLITSLGYTLFYLMIHRWQLRPRNVTAVDPIQAVIRGANVFSGAFILFYVFIGLLLLIMAVMLAVPFFRRQPTWHAANWWLYPVLILAVGVAIVTKNMNVVRADMYLKQGEQYRNQGQYDNAIVLHQRSINLDSDEDFYYLMLALDYQLKGQDGRISNEDRAQAWREGEKTAAQARDINRYNPDNTGNMGRYYFTWAQVSAMDDPQRPTRFQQALEFFEKATQLAPQNVVYYNLWAQTLYLMGQYEQAEEVLQTSFELDSKFVQTPMLLGDNYAAMGRPQDAAQAHRTAILLSPDAFADQFLDTRLNFYLSVPQDTPGSVGDIISAFDEARAIHPTNVVIPRTLGHIYTRMGEHQKAISYYQQAIDMGDEDVQTMLAIADAYLALEDFENAAQAYREVLRRNPEHVQAHSNLGYVYAWLGRPDEAIQENLQVLALSPEDYVSQRNLVLLYRDSGRLDEAIQQAEDMTQVTPDNERGNTYFLLGTLYEAATRPDEAIAAYTESIAADPNLLQAQAALGNLYLGQGRLEEALPAFQAVAQLNPNDYAVHQQLALIYQQLGRYDEALAAANQALNLAPDDVKESLQQLVSQIEGQRGS